MRRPPEVMRGHVALVRLDSLGDVLLTGGAVRAVARSARRVSLVVAGEHRAAAALLPGVDDVIGLDVGWVPLDPDPVDPQAIRRAVRRLRRRRIDAAFVLTSFHQSPLPTALLLRLAGVPWIGATSTDYPGSLLDLRHRLDGDLPEAERNLSLVTAAGFTADADGARARLRPTGPVPSWLPTPPYVVVHPGAAVAARRPSAAVARRLVAALAADGWTVVVTGGPSETGLTAQVAGQDGVDAGGRLDLATLAATLGGAAVVVAPNTGPAHLAAAVGTPVVSLFAPVVTAARWAPYGVPVVLLGDQDAACRDSRARRCPVPGHPCLDTITPAQVVAAVRSLAGAEPAGGRAPAETGTMPEPAEIPALAELPTPADFTARTRTAGGPR